MIDTASVDQFLAQTLRRLRQTKPAPWLENCDRWQTVWGRIEYHGLVLALHNEAERLDGWSENLLERIAEEARLIVLWEATHQKLIAQCVEELAHAGIDTIVMKGTALAYSLHTEPATRRRGDTDLLVRPDALEQTRSILAGLGWYRRDEPHGLYFQEGWQHEAAGFFIHSIDLHWKPVDRPVLHDVLPLDRFFEDREPLQRLSNGAYRPDIGTMILHAVINQKWHAQHGYHAEDGRLMSPRRLIWSIDFDLMAQSMNSADWDQLLKRSLTAEVAPLVAEAWLGTQQDLGTSLPDRLIDQMRQAPLKGDLADYFANPDSLRQFWLDLRNSSGWNARMRLLLTRAFPPRKHLVEKYPAASKWPTILLQGRVLIETASRMVRRAGK